MQKVQKPYQCLVCSASELFRALFQGNTRWLTLIHSYFSSLHTHFFSAKRK